MIEGIAPPAAAAAGERQLQTAAREFEAMMLEKILASTRTDAGGSDWRQMADRQVARQLAASSPLGLAQLLAKSAGDRT